MYCDKDSRGLCSINDLTVEQMEIVRKALTIYSIALRASEDEDNRDQDDKAQAICSTVFQTINQL